LYWESNSDHASENVHPGPGSLLLDGISVVISTIMLAAFLSTLAGLDRSSIRGSEAYREGFRRGYQVEVEHLMQAGRY
jgi:hypothetical protein